MLCSDIKICCDINSVAISALIMMLMTTTILHCFCVLSGENHSFGYLWWNALEPITASIKECNFDYIFSRAWHQTATKLLEQVALLVHQTVEEKPKQCPYP